MMLVPTNLLIIALLVIAAFSDKVSPEKNLLVSYIGLGFPVWCFLNLCFAVFWLFFREWKYLLLSIVSFLICWNAIVQYFPYHSPVHPLPKENVIKVLTYNVMNFGNMEHSQKSPNKIVDYIAKSGADIVCLQEYAVAKSGKGLTQDVLSKALHMYPYHSVIQLSSTNTQQSGLAVFSKYPISNSRKIKYASDYNGSSVHELTIKGKKMILFNNHLESFRLTREDRSQYYSLIRTFGSDGLEDVRGTFQQKLGPAFKIRAKQAEAVAQEIRKSKADYILVCGDFNDTPISYAHHIMQGNLLDAFAESGRGMGATYNQNFFWFRIDNILCSSNMKPINCTVGKVKFSDHYPLWSYLKLN